VGARGGGGARPSVHRAGAAAGKDGEARSAAVDPAQAVNPEKVAELAKALEAARVRGEVENLKSVERRLKEALLKAGEKDGATFRFDERGLVVTIATDDVLFASGSATLQPGGRRILDAIAPELRGLPNRISVDGHTNAIPISTARFASNWELSGDRASGVVRYLLGRHGFPAGRLSATGYADTRPLLPRSDPRSVSVNRRVEIVVIARVDDAAGRAVAGLGNG
jgi:chemotaxis protein MotB